MIYIFYKMFMFKTLNINECIFFFLGGGGGGVGERIASIMSLDVNKQCVKM